MFSYRAQGLLAIGLGLATLGACEDPELKTSLRPEGDPEVLTVLVGVDFDIFSEVATFCKENDEKVPIFNPGGLQICPEPGTDDPPVSEVSNAVPGAWFGRVVFDELLDPDVEDLVDAETGGPCTDDSVNCSGTLARTQPLLVECGGAEIAYEGWYDPTGNAVTLPPGPSILFFPIQDIATSSECTVTVRATVVDKEGNAVPESQRGPYGWAIDAFAIVATDPEASDPPAQVAPEATPVIIFNYLLDETSVDAGEITLEAAGGGPVGFTAAVDAADGTALVITPNNPLAEGDYVLTVTAGAGFTDVAGGTMTVTDAIVVPFTVVPAA